MLAAYMFEIAWEGMTEVDECADPSAFACG